MCLSATALPDQLHTCTTGGTLGSDNWPFRQPIPGILFRRPALHYAAAGTEERECRSAAIGLLTLVRVPVGAGRCIGA